MAVLSRTSAITLSVATGTRTWEAIAVTQDTAAGGSVNITVTVATTGASPPQVPNSLALSIRVDNGATVIRTFTLTPGLASQTVSFSFTSDGTSGASGRCGVVRMRLLAIKDDGSVTTNYNVNSDDTVGQVLPAGYSVTRRDQGWMRGTTTATSKVNITGHANAAYTGTYAYPDTVFYRLTLGALSYDLTKAIFVTLGGVKSSSSLTDADADANYDATFTNGIDSTFTLAVTSRLCQIAAVASSTLTGNDFFSLSQTTQTITVDPRLTFVNAVRTSPLAVVNYGLHTVTGTFNALNARSETLNATTHGARANLTVQSLDIVGNTGEKTISASLAPAGVTPELYSVSYVFNGPTSLFNRGIGLQGDTAAHTLAGKAKGLRAFPVNDVGNIFNSAPLVALSDFLRIDCHPQKTSELSVDDDPYAPASPQESQFYTVALDEMFGFAYVGDVNGAPVNGAAVKLTLFDPTGVQTADGERSGLTGANGYMVNGIKFFVTAPVGTWRFRSRVELDHVGASGNYGDATTTSGNTLIGSLIQDVGFVSPYSADRSLVIQFSGEVEIGAAKPIIVEYINSLGTRLALDSAPDVRIYRLAPDTGEQIEDLAPTTCTKIGATDSYKIDWTPSVNGIFNIEVRALNSQAGISASRAVEVRPRRVYDPIQSFN